MLKFWYPGQYYLVLKGNIVRGPGRAITKFLKERPEKTISSTLCIWCEGCVCKIACERRLTACSHHLSLCRVLPVLLSRLEALRITPPTQHQNFQGSKEAYLFHCSLLVRRSIEWEEDPVTSQRCFMTIWKPMHRLRSWKLSRKLSFSKKKK